VTVRGVVLTAERTEGRRNRITSLLARREAGAAPDDDDADADAERRDP